MIKRYFALSGTLLLMPMSAFAQDAEPGLVEGSLPAVTVYSEKQAQQAKRKVAKKKSASKNSQSPAASAPNPSMSDADLSPVTSTGLGLDSQGVRPPSVTAQTVGGVIISDPTPGRVSSVSREGLNILGGAGQSSFYQAADIIPSVLVSSPDPFGLSNSRNINIGGKSDFHLSRNINGLPIMGIVGANDLYDLQNISRLDVYRGVIPADRSLGISNATGVIDQIILGPQDAPSVFAEQSFGSWNFNKTFARIDTGVLSTGTQLFISGSTASADKWSGGGDESRDSFALGLSQRIGSDLKVDFNAVYTKFDGNPYKALTFAQTKKLSANYGLDYDKTFDPTNPTNYYKFNKVSSEDYAFFANVDYRFAPGQHLVFKPYYWNNDGVQYNGLAPVKQVQIWRQQNDNLGGVLEYNGQFASGTDVTAGYWWQSLAPPPPPTDQRRFKISSTGELSFSNWNTIAKIDNFVINSPYVQVTQSLGSVTVSGGVRYMSLGAPDMHYYMTAGVPNGTLDDALSYPGLTEYGDAFVTARDYNEFLPNIAITKEFGNGWSTNFAYGRNFGRPDWGPQASNYISNRAAFQSRGVDLQDLVDNVRPEIADQFSAQLRYSGSGLTVVPGVFYSKHDNKQVKINDPALNNLAYFVGTGSSTEYGAELQASYNFGSQFFAFGSATLSSETFDGDTQTLSGGVPIATNGKQIPNTPKAMLKAGVTYTWNDLAFTPVVRIIGERYGDAQNLNKVPGYTVADFNVAYNVRQKFGFEEATLKLGVVNILDKQYISQISPNDTDLSSDAQYYVGAPRTFIGTVAVKF
ncbi:TonB-dependent receptor [Hyphomicrobium methylovorum]|uniref:TonB-dependent receptor domain-containing protein n=1 Tax=Hyphomicrobium methylovorum TaxID=84 RepID=UPI0015E76DC1|nr:TonB-dependent receptor [Hyphomicrobium methylovorum]MBA2124763.1 TonB-dependent receptor [Hyphomicrobium methylovorum]